MSYLFFCLPFLVLLILWIIAKADIRKLQLYTIKKGDHYSQFNPSRLLLCKSDYIAFSVIFSKGCDYTVSEVNQLDINKLYGFGWGLRGPSYNSYRVGWRWDVRSQKIQVFLFVQEKGSMWYDLMGSCDKGDQVTFRIMIDKGILFAYFYPSTSPASVSRYVLKNKVGKWKYRCLPYFGGKAKSPADVNILIKEIA